MRKPLLFSFKIILLLLFFEGCTSDQADVTLKSKKPTYNSEAEKLAYFYTFRPILKIFDTKGDLLKQVKYEINQNKPMENQSEILYSVSPASTSKHIYSLYLGDSKENVFHPESNFLPELLVWNWEDELVKVISWINALLH